MIDACIQVSLRMKSNTKGIHVGVHMYYVIILCLCVGVQTQTKQYVDCAVQCSLLPAPPLSATPETEEDETETEEESDSDCDEPYNPAYSSADESDNSEFER